MGSMENSKVRVLKKTHVIGELCSHFLCNCYGGGSHLKKSSLQAILQEAHGNYDPSQAGPPRLAQGPVKNLSSYHCLGLGEHRDLSTLTSLVMFKF